MIAATRQPKRALGRVLVVDDEPLIRTFVVRALTSAGYQVVEAGSAERALDIFTRQPSAFSMVVSDIGLPGASGFELTTELVRLRPSLATLLMSASPSHELAKHGTVAPDTFILQKPFRVADLLGRVNTAHSVSGLRPRS